MHIKLVSFLLYFSHLFFSSEWAVGSELVSGSLSDEELQVRELKQIIEDEVRKYLKLNGFSHSVRINIQIGIKKNRVHANSENSNVQQDRIVTHISALRKNIHGPKSRRDLKTFSKIEVQNSVFDFINSVRSMVVSLDLGEFYTIQEKEDLLLTLDRWSKRFYHLRPTFFISSNTPYMEISEPSLPWKLALGCLLIGFGLGLSLWLINLQCSVPRAAKSLNSKQDVLSGHWQERMHVSELKSELNRQF